MASHFLLKSEARSLSLVQIMTMTDEKVEATFAKARWPETNGEPVCPHCGGLDAYDCRRGKTPRYRCRACRKDFSITSGTIFASHKLPLRMYLAAILIFVNEVKGKSALAMSRDLGVSYKSAFVLAHKLREAMSEEMKGEQVGGEGEEVEVDGAVFGHYVKPANLREDRRDRRLKENLSKRKRFVVVIRERGGRTIPAIFNHESQAHAWINRRVRKGTTVHADSAPAWNDLHARFEVKRIDHQEAYSLADACTNMAESFFSRIRRGEMGHHHHISGPYLVRYAQESAWREDHRRTANGEQANRVMGLALTKRTSVDFVGYWQRFDRHD
jgi:transposase-like protein